MEENEKINLTDKDFKMILDGLDFLPHKDAAANMMMDIIKLKELVESGDDHETVARKLKSDMEIRERETAAKMGITTDDIKILQGKIIMLKRYLMEQSALKITDVLK